MKALNIAVTDNIYTFLRMFRSPAAIEMMLRLHLPDYWSEPQANLFFKHDSSLEERSRLAREMDQRARDALEGPLM